MKVAWVDRDHAAFIINPEQVEEIAETVLNALNFEYRYSISLNNNLVDEGEYLD